MGQLRIDIGGDPEGGWIMDMHDGDQHKVMSGLKGDDAFAVLDAGLKEWHGEEDKPAEPEPAPKSDAGGEPAHAEPVAAPPAAPVEAPPATPVTEAPALVVPPSPAPAPTHEPPLGAPEPHVG